MLIELNCFLGGTHTVFNVARPCFLYARDTTRSGGAKETMLIKRRDNRLFSQTTPGSFRRPGRFALDFDRDIETLLIHSIEDDPAGRT